MTSRGAKQGKSKAALLQHTRKAIATPELQGRILFWNRGAEQLHDWTAEEVIGREMHDLLHQEQASSVGQRRPTP